MWKTPIKHFGGLVSHKLCMDFKGNFRSRQQWFCQGRRLCQCFVLLLHNSPPSSLPPSLPPSLLRAAALAAAASSSCRSSEQSPAPGVSSPPYSPRPQQQQWSPVELASQTISGCERGRDCERGAVTIICVVKSVTRRRAISAGSHS